MPEAFLCGQAARDAAILESMRCLSWRPRDGHRKTRRNDQDLLVEATAKLEELDVSLRRSLTLTVCTPTHQYCGGQGLLDPDLINVVLKKSHKWVDKNFTQKCMCQTSNRRQRKSPARCKTIANGRRVQIATTELAR